MDNDQKCRKFLLRRRRTDLEFGWGMYARGSNYVADTNQEYHRWALRCNTLCTKRFVCLGIASLDSGPGCGRNCIAGSKRDYHTAAAAHSCLFLPVFNRQHLG